LTWIHGFKLLFFSSANILVMVSLLVNKCENHVKIQGNTKKP